MAKAVPFYTKKIEKINLELSIEEAAFLRMLVGHVPTEYFNIFGDAIYGALCEVIRSPDGYKYFQYISLKPTSYENFSKDVASLNP